MLKPADHPPALQAACIAAAASLSAGKIIAVTPNQPKQVAKLALVILEEYSKLYKTKYVDISEDDLPK